MVDAIYNHAAPTANRCCLKPCPEGISGNIGNIMYLLLLFTSVISMGDLHRQSLFPFLLHITV
uniref:Uncharacterized protein n=1 Tax=Anguilla anguilla TaxID=7936 RepID=A0A0E9RIK6_ANGAN